MDIADLDVAVVVRPVQIRLAVKQIVHLVLVVAALALAASAVVQAGARTLIWPAWDPLGGSLHWIMAIALAAPIMVSAGAWRAWPRLPDVVRYADDALGFKDRLATAYQFRGQQGIFFRLQRAELAARLGEVDIRRSSPPAVSRLDLVVAAAMTLLLLGALALPDRQAGARRQQDQNHAVALQAAHDLARVERTLRPLPAAHGNAARSPSAAEQRAEQALRDAEAALARAQNKAAALKAIARARQQLQQIQAQGQAAAVQLQRLAQSLKGGPTAQLSQAIASGQASAMQQAAQSLAANVPKQTAQQRASLVQSLERAANAADPSLSQSLRDAASSAANHDSSGTSQALQSLSNNLAREQGQAAAQSAGSKGLTALQQARQQIANAQGLAQPKQTAQAPNKPSSSRNAAQGRQGTGQQSGSGRAGAGRNATARGTSAVTAGAQHSSSAQQGTGQSANSQGGGGAQAGSPGQSRRGGSGSGQRGAGGARAGHLETVYTTIREGNGPAAGQLAMPGTSVPVQSGAFQQLLARYQAAASAGMGRSSLPSDLQADVLKYFKALGAG